MILNFLRHAQAEPLLKNSNLRDRDRRLTAEGRETMQNAAKGFLKMGVRFDRIVSSPAIRALETAQIVADIFHFQHEIAISENLLPEALFHRFRKELQSSWARDQSILLVTHQPFVSECIACFLTGQDIPLAVDMGTGTMCSLEIDSALKGPAILNSMIRVEAAAWMGVTCD